MQPVQRCHRPQRTSVQLTVGASRPLPEVASHAIGFAEPGHADREPGFGAYEDDGQGQVLPCPQPGKDMARMMKRWVRSQLWKGPRPRR